MSLRKATLLVLGAGVLWGIISLFVRVLNASGLTSFDISLVRMSVGAVGMALVLFCTDRSKFCIRFKDIWMFIGTGMVSVALFNVCYFTCMQMSEASIAVVLLYTSPAWVMLMSAIFFRERVTPLKLVALVMTLAGCVLVSGVVGNGFKLSPLALCIGIASGIFYACYSIFGRVALRRYDTMTVTFYTFLMGTIASLVVASPSNIAGCIATQHSTALWCIGIGVVCTIIPYLLYTKGLANMETGRAAILATAEPLVGALLGIFAYGESTGILKIAGMAMILGAVLVIELGGRKKDMH